MKILITNAVALNVGDAAILKGILKLLYSTFGEETQIAVYDSKPEIARRYYPDIQFHKSIYNQGLDFMRLKRPARVIFWLNYWRIYLCSWLWSRGAKPIAAVGLSESEVKALQDYSSADLIISTGGTYLVENYALEPRILDFKIASMLGRPLILFTQSLGPFTKSKYQRAFRDIFAKSSLILLRDRQSEKHISQLSSDRVNTLVTADAAFALSNADALAKAQTRISFPSHPKVAISVRDWKHFKAADSNTSRAKYLNSVAELCTYLVEKHQAEITFLSTCQGIDEYWLDDSKVALEIVQLLPENIAKSVKVNHSFHSPQNLMATISNYDLVVATRMHMAILALGVGVPVFPISYEFKIEELFSRLGQEKWIADIDEIDPNSIVELMESYLQAVPELNQKVFSSVMQERETAWKSIAKVAEVVNKTK